MRIAGVAIVVLALTACSAAQSVPLQTQPPATGAACDLALLSGRLVPDPGRGLGLEGTDPQGNTHITHVVWPNGYSARQEQDGIVLLDPSGRVVAHQGEYISSAGSVDDQGVAWPCGTIKVSASPSASTPIAGTWTGLRWSEGALPLDGDQFTAILPWQGRFIAAGTEKPGESAPNAFFTSDDGLHWTRTQENDSGGAPITIVPLGSGLLGISAQPVIIGCSPCGEPTLWQSPDGVAWHLVSSPSWHTIWGDVTALQTVSPFLGAAGNASGAVAIGMQDATIPMLLHSPDGRTWSRLDLPPAFDHAIFSAVSAIPGGFLIVGRDGEPDNPGSGGVGLQFGMGRPAAWFSPDGLTWTASEVEGTAVPGGRLDQVAVGSAGLFAEGVDSADSGRGPASGWVSTDGRTWRLLGEMGQAFPPGTSLSSDGQHIVLLGSAPENAAAGTLAGWVSADGATWTRLKFTGAVAGLPTGSPSEGMTLEQAWTAPSGVLVWGIGSVPQEYWFGTASGS